MWVHRCQQRADLACEQLWPVLADVARWPESDRNIKSQQIEGEPAPGKPFTLGVRNGPRLKFMIGEFSGPHRDSDNCRLPLARMQTPHTLIPGTEGSTVRIDIEIEGPLAPVWGLLVGRKHASGLPAQTERLIASARARLHHA